jgi:hypothetical protein
VPLARSFCKRTHEGKNSPLILHFLAGDRGRRIPGVRVDALRYAYT